MTSEITVGGDRQMEYVRLCVCVWGGEWENKHKWPGNHKENSLSGGASYKKKKKEKKQAPPRRIPPWVSLYSRSLCPLFYPHASIFMLWSRRIFQTTPWRDRSINSQRFLRAIFTAGVPTLVPAVDCSYLFAFQLICSCRTPDSTRYL